MDQVTIADKFHATCRCPRRQVPWLLPSKVLHPLEASFRDEIRMDMSKFSDETLELILTSPKDPLWLKRIAVAEKLHRA